MRTTYILIDYENVQTIDFQVFEADEARVLVFLGENQTKLGADLVLRMQALGSRGEFVQLSGSGPNALDFTIAFTIGQLSRDEPAAYFLIISKDTGFDPLIKHLKSKKILSARHESISDAPFMKARSVTAPAARAETYIARLKELKATKPRTLATLSNSIQSAFQGQLTPQDIEAIVERLKARKLITVDGVKVTYLAPLAHA